MAWLGGNDYSYLRRLRQVAPTYPNHRRRRAVLLPWLSIFLIGYYGWYSNRMRGERRKLEEEGSTEDQNEEPVDISMLTMIDDGWPGYDEPVYGSVDFSSLWSAT